MKLRTRLFVNFGFSVVLLGMVIAFVGVQFLQTQTIHRAQSQAQNNLNSAWNFLHAEMNQLETVLRLSANRDRLVQDCIIGKWNDPSLRNQLEIARMNYGIDFLSIVTPNGQVVVRGSPPYAVKDYFLSEPLVQRAFRGEQKTGITLMSSNQLDREHIGLAQRAFLLREDTPHARPGITTTESRGMVLFSAIPIFDRNNVVAVMYGGILLNRNEPIVRKIEKSTFRDEKYDGVAIGSVTLFLYDCRVATTVLQKNGNLALGTIVSKEVADQVLDNGTPWIGRAFVVNDWYLTAYEPIRNINNEIIGMFYVGILEKPFNAVLHTLVLQFGAIIVLGTLLTLVLAFFIAGRMTRTLHALAAAAEQMARGERPHVTGKKGDSNETKQLVRSFNTMAGDLADREDKLHDVNESLRITNHSYMETIGYISHELKTPLGSIMNYVYLLAEQKWGSLTEKQLGAVRSIDLHTKRITEMVRHYLNLSRIENKQLDPKPVQLNVRDDILNPLLDSLAVSIQDKNQTLCNHISKETVINADFNMMFEVFENMISNAVKYGNDGGTITLKAHDMGEMIAFHVHNTGNGIPADKRTAIFEKFYRIEDEKTGKKKKGTGLGLFITKHIIEAHGGKIDVTSEEGAWTEFVFTLPQYHQSKGVKNDTAN